ncbi:thyroid adenoma-associated protein homolog isoform X2 [Xenopus laevis]|nr:thyroid adenoma-associated protein homolog isoform X2 [Xenopus laevis]
MIAKLSEVRPDLVSQQVESLLSQLFQSKDTGDEKYQVLHIGDLQTVCMYLEGSYVGRKYFKQHLHLLLSKVFATFSLLLQNQAKQREDPCYLAVKVCLQIFRVLGEDIAPLVWTPACSGSPLQNILTSLLKVVTNQNMCPDTRLLAGTAVASLAITGPDARSGAHACLTLMQQLREESSGLIRFGELQFSITRPLSDELSLIVVVRGLLTCASADLLTSELPAFSQNKIVLELLLPFVASACEGNKEHYYSFQVLSLWLQRLRELTGHMLKVREVCPLVTEQETLCLVTRLLWSGAELQVDGMSDLVLSCFQHFLHIYGTECQLLGLPVGPMFHKMLKKITKIPWQCRSRYIPLCALLPFIGPKEVLEFYPDLPSDLFHCLCINYLCPPASETFRIFIGLQHAEWSRNGRQNEKEMASLWAMNWLSPLYHALTSRKSSLQTNCSTYFLPCTLRFFPGACALLADRLQGSDPAEMRGWVSLLQSQKIVLGRVSEEINEKLQLCLESADDSVRLCAFNFLCCSPRSSQPPALHELKMLKKYLPFNLGCDSPGFRQQLQAVLKKATDRLRDAALAALRKKRTKADEVSQVIDFLEWLLQLSISSLSPAGNYQRRCSGLLLLSVLLESCTDSWTPQRKKGQPPSDMPVLLNYAKQKGCWDFFSPHNMQALLGCMQDSTNEIRELASDLLVRFFPAAPEPLTLAMFDLGQEFICSPRVFVAESGALLLKTVMQRLDGGLPFPADEPFTTMSFVTYLTKKLTDHYHWAQKNMLHAATCKPLHGVLSALRLCLLDVPSVNKSLSNTDLAQGWHCLFEDLVSSLKDITSFILSVLYGAQGEEGSAPAAPSFADMGKAVSALIAQGQGLDEVHGNVFLSEEHSLIMTCCWVSLKEIGLLLGPLVEKLVCGHTALLSTSAVQKSVAAYQDICLRCRHWGAVDGCSTGFIRLCSALLNHEDPTLRAIPKDMIEQALARCRSQNSLSVTRRAAGFPVLLQCILCAEGTLHPLLTYSVESLLELAQEPLPSHWDQTRDLPQVSAVHALQTLIRSAGLRSSLLVYAVPLMSLALCYLRSPCWAMRNAALQLFSVLTNGILGLSRSDANSSVQSTLSLGTLLRKFPGMQGVLLQELCSAQHADKMLHPSVHPPLALLAKLQAGGDNDGSCFLEPLLKLAGNPIYAVRVMAARALVPVVQVMNYHTLLLQLIGKLPQDNESVSHNYLHGNLLQIHALLVPALNERCLTEDVLEMVQQKLLAVLWLLSPAQKCPLVRAAFLDILSVLVPSCGKEFARLVRKAILNTLKAKMQSIEVGSAVFHDACVAYLCNEAASSSDATLYPYVSSALRADEPAALKWVNENQERDLPLNLASIVRDTLQEMLCSRLLSEGPSAALVTYLESFVYIHTKCSQLADISPSETADMQCIHVLLSLLESDKVTPQLRSCALSTVGLLLKHWSVKDVSLVSTWLLAIFCCAKLSCEKLRLAAAQALELAGTQLVRFTLKETEAGITNLAVRAIACGVDLLQDEDRGVREAAARFAVYVLAQPANRTMQSDRALLHLLNLLREHFVDCEETFISLMLRLPPFDVDAALSSLLERSVSLYEEDQPNVFADSRFLTSILLPQLSSIINSASLLSSAVLQWVTSTLAPLRQQIQRCLHWCTEQGPFSKLWLKASGCPHVNIAVLGLLVRGKLVLKALQTLSENEVLVAHLDISPSCLKDELSELQAQLTLHGIGLPLMETTE